MISFRKLYSIGFCLSMLSSLGQNSFSPDQVQRDLNFVYDVLREAHYDPYLYTSKAELDSAYRFINESIGIDSMSAREANALIQRFVSNVNNAHTTLQFPIQSYVDYANDGGTVFPFELSIKEGDVRILRSFVEGLQVSERSRIVSLDGVPISEVLRELGYYMPAEDEFFKMAKIEALSFSRLYWQVHGRRDSFLIEIWCPEMGRDEFTIAAVPVISGYEERRDEILNARPFIGFNENIALLDPGPFSGDKSKYERFIDSAFQEITEYSPETLYIDLRYNSGGDDAFSNYLVSYIADEPFKWCSDYKLRSSRQLKEHTRANFDTTESFFQAILNARDGEVVSYDFGFMEPKPLAQRYTGEVVVLINRQTHSQAVVTAAQITDYDWGTTMGQVTGEYPSLCASLFSVALPETGFTLVLSKGFIVRVNGDVSEHGLQPDIQVHDLPRDDEELLAMLKDQ